MRNEQSRETRHKSKTDETKNTTQYVLETTIQKTQDEDRRNKKHNTICVGHHYAQTNTDSVNKTSIFSGYQNDYKHIKAKPRTKA